MRMRRHWKPRRSDRIVIGVVASLAILVPLGWLWTRSLVPDTYSVMDMGYADYGGGPAGPGHEAHAAGPTGAPGRGDVPVTALTGPRTGRAHVEVTLVARRETITLASGETVDGYTLNHSSPGPLLRVRQNELLQVTLINASVPDGVTLHWHGVDVPNAEDGVAGVTQDAVAPGSRHVYRFVAQDGPVVLRVTDRHRVRPGGRRSPLRVIDRQTSRLHRRRARAPLVDQRAPPPGRPDVHGGRGRRHPGHT